MDTGHGFLRKYARPVLPALFLVASVFLQVRYDELNIAHTNPRAPIHRYVMPAPFVQYTAFGFDHVLADYYWISAVQDMLKWDRKDTYYPEYFHIITTLDPKFYYPYLFGILTIPTGGNTSTFDAIALLAERGMRALPERWEIPFYTAVEYHFLANDYVRSAHYMEMASQTPGAPEVAKRTYAIYLMLSKTDNEKSRALFTAMYETSDNDETRRIAKERIALLDLISELERLTKIYHGKHGEYPSSVQDIEKRLRVALPEDLVTKYPIHINKATGEVVLTRK